jgi:hypothetical protein
LTGCGALISLAIVFRCVGRIATIVALCCAIGLQWVALQSVAWATMIVDYSKRAPLCSAIAQTFDGTHPCSLCHAVDKGKASEKRSDMQSTAPKIDIICVTRTIRLMALVTPLDFAVVAFSLPERRHSPPVPPPRSLPG